MKLFGALRHPVEPRTLLLRSDRAWRLPRVVAGELWIAQADKVADAFERRLGMRPWLLRQLRFGEDEAVFELELSDPGWRAAVARPLGRPRRSRRAPAEGRRAAIAARGLSRRARAR